LDPRGERLNVEEGMVGPNSDEGTDTLVLYVYYNLLYIYCFPAGNFIFPRVPRILSINLLSQLPEDSRK
jgi:hypothetical protein